MEKKDIGMRYIKHAIFIYSYT